MTQTIGWREWVVFPELAKIAVKAKIDTGARSSSLHAFGIREFERDGKPWLSFEVHPVQRRREPSVRVAAPLVDRRRVKSSNGATEARPVVRTVLALGGSSHPIDLTLSNRDEMGFRLLLGRQTIRGRYLVDPARSYLRGEPT